MHWNINSVLLVLNLELFLINIFVELSALCFLSLYRANMLLYVKCIRNYCVNVIFLIISAKFTVCNMPS